MNLEQQVCSLDLAKRLKELGVKQESAFYWKQGYYNSTTLSWVLRNQYEAEYPQSAQCSAFTVGELGEMLPDGMQSGRDLTTKGYVA